MESEFGVVVVKKTLATWTDFIMDLVLVLRSQGPQIVFREAKPKFVFLGCR
jgi:hypothetical protein